MMPSKLSGNFLSLKINMPTVKKGLLPYVRNKPPAVIFTALLFATMLASAAPPIRERSSFDANWRFIKGDPDGASNELSYSNIKPWVMANGNEFVRDGTPAPRPVDDLGTNVPYVQSDFNDNSWRELNLPQDWGVEESFQQEYPGETAKLPWWGIG